MRVATRSRKARSWVMATTLPLKSISSCSSHWIESRSRWLVGSSSSRTSGWLTSAWASATRLRVPPDSALICALVQMQAMQGLLDALLPVPAVLRLNRALQGIEVALTVRVLFDQLDQSLEACAHRSEHGVVRVQQRFLGDKRQAHALLELDHSVVRFLHASQDLEQRGLARAVASDEADALATLQREAGLVEKCHVPEGQMGVNECDQCHVSGIIRPASRRKARMHRGRIALGWRRVLIDPGGRNGVDGRTKVDVWARSC
jgi:hypothetical protein